MNHLTSGVLLNGRYQLERVLQAQQGQTLWQAVETHSGQSVIVKVLDLGTIPDWDALRLFERELQVLKSLQHPRIPAVLDYFQTQEPAQQFLVMPTIAGISLRQHLQQHGPLTEVQAKSLARQTLEILRYLHSFSPPVIHRDLNPDHLLLDAQQAVFLVDFGSVKALNSTQQTVVGSFAYLAPEQLAGQAVAASDLYALGITLTEALSGISAEALPRDGLTIHLHQVIKVSAGFADWLQELLASETSLRFKSAQQALDALNALAEAVTLPALTHSPGSRLSLTTPGPDQLVIEFGPSRRLRDLLSLLVLPVLNAGLIGLPVLFLLFESGFLAPRLDPVSNLLQGRLLPEWWPVLPVMLLVYAGFTLQFYRLWYRPLRLSLDGSRLRCESRSKVYWDVDLQTSSKLQILSRRLLVTSQASAFKQHQIALALTSADAQQVKTLLRDYLRQQLPRDQFQQLLPGLKS